MTKEEQIENLKDLVIRREFENKSLLEYKSKNMDWEKMYLDLHRINDELLVERKRVGETFACLTERLAMSNFKRHQFCEALKACAPSWLPEKVRLQRQEALKTVDNRKLPEQTDD